MSVLWSIHYMSLFILKSIKIFNAFAGVYNKTMILKIDWNIIAIRSIFVLNYILQNISPWCGNAVTRASRTKYNRISNKHNNYASTNIKIIVFRLRCTTGNRVHNVADMVIYINMCDASVDMLINSAQCATSDLYVVDLCLPADIHE